MKFICVIFATLLFAQVYAEIPAIFETEDLTLDECVDAADCMAEKFNEHEFELDVENSVVVDVVTSLIEVVQGYLHCQNILGDPPSRVQEIQHQACMAIWSAQTLLTALRLQRVLEETSENVRTIWGTVQDNCSAGRPILPCINHLIEDPNATDIVPYLQDEQ